MTVMDIVRFIKEMYPPWKDFEDRVILGDLKWYMDRMLMLPSVMGNNMYAVVAIRKLRHPWEYQDKWIHHQDGKIAFIDMAISREPTATAECMYNLATFHAPVEKIMWNRVVAGEDRIRVYTPEQACRMMLLMGKLHYGRKSTKNV
jgi:hypothetical protein